MNKILVGLAFAASAFTVPVLSFAQSTAPVTRAEVRADLVRVEQAGYNPARGNDNDYPADIQAAEAKIAANPVTDQQGYGGVSMTGKSSAGAPSRSALNTSCVGPVSYCNTFFGS